MPANVCPRAIFSSSVKEPRKNGIASVVAAAKAVSSAVEVWENVLVYRAVTCSEVQGWAKGTVAPLANFGGGTPPRCFRRKNTFNISGNNFSPLILGSQKLQALKKHRQASTHIDSGLLQIG